MLTLREAAEVLRLNPRTVRAYVRRGEIEAQNYWQAVEIQACGSDSFFESASSYWEFVGNGNNRE